MPESEKNLKKAKKKAKRDREAYETF